MLRITFDLSGSKEKQPPSHFVFAQVNNAERCIPILFAYHFSRQSDCTLKILVQQIYTTKECLQLLKILTTLQLDYNI
jgi:hypothetical protein